ncbi:MAG TPA: multicopper oxidase family protein [Candidatus Binatia bacterium]
MTGRAHASRRRFLALGAACAGAALGSRFGVFRPQHAWAQEPSPNPTLRPGEEMLLVARREVSPAGQRVKGIVANQTFPSYELRARQGELLRVTVENELDQPTAVHFHGVLAPNAMDGVPGLTQPPIEPRQSYVYELPLVEPGTYFYESTWKLQRQLGLVGALVVEARDEPHEVKHDLVLLLTDWTNSDPARIVGELRNPPTPVPGEAQAQRLINLLPGDAPFPIDVRYSAYLVNGRSHRDAWTHQVSPGERVRLRLINASSATFFRFMVEGHALQVVAADGRAVEPVEVDDLVLGTGERYDVILTMGAAGSYSLRAAALGAPGGAIGVLHTPGVRPVVSTRPPRWGERHLTYAMLRAPQDTAFSGASKAKRIRMRIGGDVARYLWNVDGFTYPGEFVSGEPKSEPLALSAGERVELELVNETTLWQPLHLHGYRFRLLAGQGARAPWKDTVAVAPGKSVKIEFLADRPGRWLLTSCNVYRAQSGLARLLTVEG